MEKRSLAFCEQKQCAGDEDELAVRLQREELDDVIRSDPQSVLALMKEGVVEDPNVDHEPETESQQQLPPGGEEQPSQEELASGAARVVKIADPVDEQTVEEEEFEDAPAATQATAASDSAIATVAPPQNIIQSSNKVKIRAQVKGPKAFKMVNSHFLALIDAWTNAGWTRLSDAAYTSGVSLLLTKVFCSTKIATVKGKTHAPFNRF